MSDLVAFLNARLDEDEAAARLAMDGGKTAFVDCDTDIEPLLFNSDGEFVVAKRMLAEVAAKRRIVAIHGPQSEYGVVYCQGCGFGNDGEFYMPVDECPEKRALAAVHAGHPDYQEEWSP